MFTELSSRERVSVCENMHLSDNLHFTDSRRRTSMYLLGVNHLFYSAPLPPTPLSFFIMFNSVSDPFQVCHLSPDGKTFVALEGKELLFLQRPPFPQPHSLSQ